MKALLPLGFLVLIVLQGTWLPHLRIAGVMPDAVVVVLSTWALLVGGLAVLPFAAAGGLLMDLIAGTPLGMSAAALLVAVLAIGWWRGAIFYTGIGLFIAAALVATLVYDATLLIGKQTFHDLINWPLALEGVVAPSALLNAALAVPSAYFGGWLAGRMGLVESK